MPSHLIPVQDQQLAAELGDPKFYTVTRQMRDHFDDGKTYTDRDIRCLVHYALETETLSYDKFACMLGDSQDKKGNSMPTTKTPSPDQILGGEKAFSDRRLGFDATKTTGSHVKTRQPVQDESGQTTMVASQYEKAKSGALLKHLARRSGIDCTWRDQEDGDLLKANFDDEWRSVRHGEVATNIPGSVAQKALLDDSGAGLSGGLEITPVHLDQDIISFPLLHGELYPSIDLRTIAGGRRIEGASITTPTVNWGGSDNSEVALFNTASMVSAIDTSVFNCDVALEIGLDFLNDSPVDVGSLLTRLIGERFAAELDRVIAAGNGTSEPQGITVAGGTTSVSFGGVASTIGGFESLLFSVPKAYRTASAGMAFCSNEISYRRARAIAVGAGDDRRIFGMSHEDFKLLERPYKISVDLANEEIFFGALKKYRCHRVGGVSLKFETGGSYLTRKNLALLHARIRISGRIVDGSAFAVVTNALA